MRVAYVCADPGVPVFGTKGCSVHVQAMVRAFTRLGHRVELFASRVGGAPPEDLAKVPVHELPGVTGRSATEKEQRAFDRNPRIGDALAKAGPFDLVYERYSLWSFAGVEHARDIGVPGVLEINAPLVQEQAAHRELTRRALAETVARRAFAAASTRVAVSREVRDLLEEYLEPGARVHVVANGVDPERFDDLARERDPGAPFTVGFVGGLRPWHGLTLLVCAFARLHATHPNTRLLVVGDGPERTVLEREVERFELQDAVELTGAIPPSEVPGRLGQMDVGVVPYEAVPSFYFSPLKLYEYMAAGLPTVASAIGQVTEVIDHGRNGLLCEPGDAVELCAALERMYSEPELRARLGERSRVDVEREHTWDRVCERILELATRGDGSGEEAGDALAG